MRNDEVAGWPPWRRCCRGRGHGGRAGGQRRPAATPAPALVAAAAAAHRARGHRCRAQEPGRQASKIVGVSALVYQRGKEAYFGAFGLADRENNKPMARDTIVQIFSMTKPVTGVALMKLYERGKFQLDDPLASYAPEFANLKVYAGLDEAASRNTRRRSASRSLRDVLRHTAGFTASNGDDQTATGAIYREIKPARATATRWRNSRRSSRRCRWPTSPARAGCIRTPSTCRPALVQKISGVPFDRFLELHIFKPLGMTSTRFTILPTDPDRAAARRDVHAQRRRQLHAPDATRRRTSSTARAGRSSRAASAWCRPSTTT